MPVFTNNVVALTGEAIGQGFARYFDPTIKGEAVGTGFGFARARLNGKVLLREAAVGEGVADAQQPSVTTFRLLSAEAVGAGFGFARARLNGEVLLREEAVGAGTAFGRVARTWIFLPTLTAVGGDYDYAQGGGELAALEANGDGEPPPSYSIGEMQFAPMEVSAYLPTGMAGLESEGELTPLVALGADYEYAQGGGALGPLWGLGVEALLDTEGGELVQPGSTLTARAFSFSAFATLHQPSAELTAFSGGRLSVEQPAVEFTVEGTFPVVGRASLAQPAAVLEAAGTSGGLGQAALVQPDSTLVARGGGQAHLTQPAGELWVAATVGGVGRLSVDQPATVLAATGVRADTGQIQLVQPDSELVLPGALLIVDQPLMTMAASGGEQVEAPEYGAYAVNLSHAGVTTYTDYPFERILRFRGEYYGIGVGGIFRLEGYRDEEEKIRAIIETGRPDFGSSMLKRMTHSYLLLETQGALKLTSISGDGYSREFDVPAAGRTDMATRRAKMARGPKARNWGVQITSEADDALELQDLELVGEVLTRKIN